MDKLLKELDAGTCKKCRIGELEPKKVPLTYSVGPFGDKNKLTISTLVCAGCENTIINDCHTELMRKKV